MKNYVYKDATSLTKVLTIALGLSAALDGIGAISSYLEYELLILIRDGGDYTDAQLFSNDTRQMIIGGLQTVLYLATTIVFGMWTYRVSANAHSLKEYPMENSPGFAVGSYFIPIVNLWKPYQALKETYLAFETVALQKKSMAIFPLWWLVWIVSGVYGRLTFSFSLKAEEVNELITSSLIMTIGDALGVVLDVVALLIVSFVGAACVKCFKTLDSIKQDSVEPEVV